MRGRVTDLLSVLPRVCISGTKTNVVKSNRGGGHDREGGSRGKEPVLLHVTTDWAGL